MEVSYLFFYTALLTNKSSQIEATRVENLWNVCYIFLKKSWKFFYQHKKLKRIKNKKIINHKIRINMLMYWKLSITLIYLYPSYNIYDILPS